MIVHFVRRDFQDFRLGWILVFVVSLLAIPGLLMGPRGFVLYGLAWAYGMFGMAPIQEILGSTLRNQHQLSRHYLLSLPVSHTRLFQIQQLRIFVFCIPLILLAGVLPFVLDDTSKANVFIFALYYFNLVVSLGIFVHSMIWLALEQERIAGYIPRRERLWVHIKSMIIFIALFTVPTFVWQDLFRAVGKQPTIKSFTYICLIAMTATLIFLFSRNRSRWCVTRMVSDKKSS